MNGYSAAHTLAYYSVIKKEKNLDIYNSINESIEYIVLSEIDLT
jgi:hypothetical protein